jgi:arylformamidase
LLSLLLEAGIHAVEQFTPLYELTRPGVMITLFPPKIEGFGTFPGRAFARIS